MIGDWEPLHLHWSFKGEHVLLNFLVLNSFTGFLFASLFLIVLCAIERIITSYHEDIHPALTSNSRWTAALKRCLLYWIAMVLRLCYMLATMTFNMGIILVIATTLAVTQLILDLRAKLPHYGHTPLNHTHDLHHFTELSRSSDIDRPHHHQQHYSNDSDPFLYPDPHSSSTFVALDVVTPNSTTKPLQASNPTPTRPRSKSKPEGIFIHPAESNIARADVIAMQLGISGDTERVSSLPTYSPVDPNGAPKSSQWQAGKGRDVAREMMLHGRNPSDPKNGAQATSQQQQHQENNLHRRSGSFQIGEGSDSDAFESDSDDDHRHARNSETRKLVR